MGYFEGISSSSFKKDAAGRTVFYPFGVFGRGRVLADGPTEQRIRTFLTRYYMASLALIVVVVSLAPWFWAVALVLPLWLWFYLGTRPLVAGLPYSSARLTLKESYTNSAAAHSKGVLWFLLVCSLLFVLGGIFIALRSAKSEGVLIGVSSIAFFGLCSAAIGYMLRAKRA